MTRSKKSESTDVPINPDILAELFPDNDNHPGFDFGIVELAPFGRIASAVTGMGGMVTLYRRNADNAIVVSVRIGNKRDQWAFDNEEQWDAILPTIGDRFTTVYGRYLAAKRAQSLTDKP